ncbi:MAG: DNA polymerase domain-containing protein [Thermoplasmata archaeon]|nr:DNA polymerase domain-containing protein [Thermoplasmata archaeon]
MPTWNVRLLTASYSKEEDVVVEIYGKTDKNQSITVRYHGFKPYFFLVAPPSGIVAELKASDNVISVEDVELFHDGQDRCCKKVIIKYPWMVPDFRKAYASHCMVLAADIPFHHRFMYDLDLGGCVKVTGKKLEQGKYTTDLVVEASGFKNIDAFKPALKILSFDLENSIKTNEILTICCAISDGESIIHESLVGDERTMISGFVGLIKKHDPDVITGYNIDGYDIPLMLERAQHHRITDLGMGRDGAELRSVTNRFWRLHGRIIADAWWNAKMELRPKQENLNAVAKLVLNEQKDDVNPTLIDQEWAADKEKVVKYCVKDAELALRILQKIAVLEKNMDLATVSKLPLDDVLNGRTSTLIDSVLIREADRNHIAVPLTGGHTKEGMIEGGYVHTIDPGLYDWVGVLDFKSMYPSLIIAKNICFTTLSKDGTIISPEPGVRYLDKETRLGLLPQVLERLMKERDDTKAKMKAAKTPEEKNYFNGLQEAIKVLMNAVYGVFASAFYRFTNPKIGASITAFARENTKSIISQLEAEGVKVIYGDTDSVFFQSPGNTLEEALELGQSIAKRYSKEGATLEFEKIINPLFSHGAKKRYVGNIVWPEEKMIVRGYETRRSDAFDIQSNSLEHIFKLILDHDTEGAISLARDIVTSISNGEVEPEALVISRTCKPFNAYQNPDNQTTVQTAKKLIAMDYEFFPGMKVSWIVTDGRKTPIIAEPFISGRKFEHKPDYEYYARRVAMTLARVTDTFGWDTQELLTGSQQQSLFSYGSEKESKAKKKEESKIKKTDKELTLDDFL